jgi:hypothetical protein
MIPDKVLILNFLEPRMSGATRVSIMGLGHLVVEPGFAALKVEIQLAIIESGN